MKEYKEYTQCSFCGTENLTSELFTGEIQFNTNTICRNCISLCNNIIEDENITRHPDMITELTPYEIKEKLDQYVIGQEETKKVLAIAVYNHICKLNCNYTKQDLILEKSNILLIGPTGSGKTLLVKTLAKICNLPFVTVDATSLTQAGYVGEDVETIVAQLDIICKENEMAITHGIIYIDEFDKIGRKGSSAVIGRDVSGEGVQQSLLKLIEGSVVNINPKMPFHRPCSVDTSNILFICSGAFEGIDNIINERTNKKQIGFGTKEKKLELLDIQSIDIINFGILPELVGRLPIITQVEELTELEMIRILSEPKNSLLKQYIQLFSINGVELEFSVQALEKIAKAAIQKNIGARGLRGLMEKLLTEAMFEIPSNKTIRKLVVNEDLKITNIIKTRTY